MPSFSRAILRLHLSRRQMQSFFHVLLPLRRPRFRFVLVKGVLLFVGRYPNRRLCSSILAFSVCQREICEELPGSCVDLWESCDELPGSCVDLREGCEELPGSCVDLRESCEELPGSCVDRRESSEELPDPACERELSKFCAAVPCALS